METNPSNLSSKFMSVFILERFLSGARKNNLLCCPEIAILNLDDPTVICGWESKKAKLATLSVVGGVVAFSVSPINHCGTSHSCVSL